MAERVYCLYRVSTAKQVDHDAQDRADIPVQRKACREFASKMGWIIVREEQETGVSGYKVSADDRDKLQLIKKHAQEGRFDILLVFMFDRLGRKSDETPFVVEWFVKHNIKVWSVNEGEQRFESHTDRLTNYIRFWQADGESQKTSMRTKAALNQMVQEGRYRGGCVPYGYRLEKSGILNKRKHEVNKMVVDEDESQIVKLIYDLSVNKGYGVWHLASYLNEHGIRNRAGANWSGATISRILHNVVYTGVLKNGDTLSEPFEELRIIDSDLFQLAQRQMTARRNENSDKRTIPLNVKGQSLLSGNVFCGHCGGRIILTTNGKTVRLADGTALKKKRIRYICYNKTRHRRECSGQTGYTMHILDEMITEILHGIFDKMKGISTDMVIGSAFQNQLALQAKELEQAKSDHAKASKEYEALKLEVKKALLGQSSLPSDVLTELLGETRQQLLDTESRIRNLNQELENGTQRIAEMKTEVNRIISWSELFDQSEMEVKKMICSALIERVTVYRDYRLEVKLNVSVQQFLDGIDSVQLGAELPKAE